MWALLEPVFRAGETFPHDSAIREAEAQVAWVEQSQAVMVAVDATGAHVANAGYVVAEHCRSQGIGSGLCQHSLQAARRLGLKAMQFNLVVSTNSAGVNNPPITFHHAGFSQGEGAEIERGFYSFDLVTAAPEWRFLDRTDDRYWTLCSA